MYRVEEFVDYHVSVYQEAGNGLALLLLKLDIFLNFHIEETSSCSEDFLRNDV